MPTRFFEKVLGVRKYRFLFLASLLIIALAVCFGLGHFVSQALALGKPGPIEQVMRDSIYPLGLVLFALSGLATTTWLPNRLKNTKRVTFKSQIPLALGLSSALILFTAVSFISYTPGVSWWLKEIIIHNPAPVLLGLLLAYLGLMMFLAYILELINNLQLAIQQTQEQSSVSERQEEHGEPPQIPKSATLGLQPVFLIASFIIGMIPGMLLYLIFIMPILSDASSGGLFSS